MFTIAISIAVIIFALAFYAKQQGGQAGDLYKAKPLLTDNEKEFYQRLKIALPDYQVLCQVALGALLQPNVKGDK